MSFSGASGSRSSGDRSSPSNGRKRKLSSQASSSSHHNPSTIINNTSIASTSRTYPVGSTISRTRSTSAPSAKRLKTSSKSTLYSDSSSSSQELYHSQSSKEEGTDLTHNQDSTNCKYLNSGDMAHQPVNKLPCAGTNHFKVHKEASPNNHAKKPGQGKKIVIKNRKVKPDLPENYSEQAWGKLKQAVCAVHTQQPISYSLEELYKAVENMCSHKLASQLYDNLRVECECHIKSLMPTFKQPEVDHIQFLLAVNKQWMDHCRQMIMIRSIFLYLDRTYAVPSTALLSIWDLDLDLFGSLIISQTRIQTRLMKGVLALVHRERCNESVDRSLLKSLLRMFVDLQMYQVVFELDFLRETETDYRAESLRMIRDAEFTLPDYISHVDRRLSQENDRLLHYLHQSTRKPLILCVEKQLIGEHQKEILDKGFESLLEGSRHSDLSLLYKLFTRFKDGLSFICNAFSGHIKKSGAAIVGDPERDKTMVQELLELKTKMDQIIVESFENNEKLHNVVREAFEDVVNRRQNKPAELLAKYIDAQLKSGNKEWSDEELDKLLDRVMVLFRYIQGKDVFEAFYKKDFAKRLLLGKSASTDAEKSMLLKLKQGSPNIQIWC